MIGFRTRWAAFLRAFSIQGSFNYRTLIGAGFAFALVPVLRRLYKDNARLDAAVARHSELFNSHPYLAPVALGAVLRMEEAGEPASVVERFKMAVRGSLGTLGDRIIWAGWRPVCLLAALTLALLGAAWWVVVGGFLLVYNAGHLAVRAAGFRMGTRWGRDVGERLRRLPLGGVQRAMASAGGFLTGVVLVLVVAWGPVPPVGRGEWMEGPGWILVAAAAAALGIRFKSALRGPVVLVLLGFAALGIALGI
ncbi:MAG: PTS system mannose/fructose/sorbose family transporter subunit IID [Gemmatimonadota bacterium]|jgi:PTS system mannose-specific IID component